jgi:hypothetical protein
MTTNFNKQLQDETEKIQNECHEMIKGIITESPSLSYQDATNVFLFAKLAQQQIMIDMLTERIKESIILK